VRASNNEELVVGACVHGSFDTVSHFLGADDFFAGAVATTLRANLIFDMAAGSAELRQALDGAGNIEGRRSESRVNVDNQRHIADVGDTADVREYVVQCVDAQVGQPERTCGYTTARKVDGAIAGTLGQEGMVCIDGADDLQRLFFFESLAETGAGRL